MRNQSALARRAQIAQLDRESWPLFESWNLRPPPGRGLEALEASQDLLLAAREGFQRTQVESASIQNEQKLAERQLADLENRRAAYIQETVQIGESLRTSLTHLEKLESSIAETAQSLERSRARRAEAELAAQMVRERENTAVEDLNEIRVRVATERQQQENLNRQRGPDGRSAGRARRNPRNAPRRHRRLRSPHRNSRHRKQQPARIHRGLAGGMQSLEAEDRRTPLRALRSFTKAPTALEIALRSARQQLIQLQEKKGRLEVRVAQLEMRMENLRNHVSPTLSN